MTIADKIAAALLFIIVAVVALWLVAIFLETNGD